MANKKFLEEYPLYRKFVTTDFYNWTPLKDLPKPAIHMYCWRCDSDQTFNMVNEYWEVDHSEDSNSVGKTLRVRYVCSACEDSTRLFFIQFGTEKIIVKNKEGEDVEKTAISLIKVGQNPPWSIEMDKELERLLGSHAEYYKKGLICESQGYGIGAFAYFRRIVEEIIDQLLNSIAMLLDDEDKKKYQAVLAEVKKTVIAQEKIELVKDLLPSSLRPGGVNPLATIYSALSKGLHTESDEECLGYAAAVRNTLVFLVNRLVRTESENKSFTESIKKILGKKSNKV